MNTKTLLFPLIALCSCSAALADSPFDGTWQLDPAKSHLAGDVMTFEDAGNGSLKYTDSAQTYSFKPDGSSFTSPLACASKSLMLTRDMPSGPLSHR